MWTLEENSDCDVMGTLCRVAVLCSAGGVPFLENMARQLGAVSDCIVASCSLDERSFEMLKWIGV